MRTINIRRVLMYILYTVEAAIIITQVKELDQLTNILFFLTFVIVFFLFISKNFNVLKSMDILFFVILLLTTANVLINMWINDGSLSVEYLKKYVMFCITITYMRICYDFNPPLKLKRWIGMLNSIVAIILIYSFQTNMLRMYVLNGVQTSYLIFGFSNPNITAMFCLSIAVIEFASFITEKNKVIKVIHLYLLTMMVRFVWLTQSRNAILVLVISVTLFLGNELLNGKLFKSKWIIAFIVLWPIIFAVLYTFIINSESILGVFSFLDYGEGKSLDSRVIIWTHAWENFAKSPVFGAYYEISNGTGGSQLHNTHLDILASYGVGVYVLVIVYLFNIFSRSISMSNNRKLQVYLLGAISVYMLGMGEAALFSGGLGIYLYLGAMLLMAKEGKE